MVSRRKVEEFTKSRRYLELMFNEILSEKFKDQVDLNALIQDPVNYLKEFFLTQGLKYIQAFAEDAKKIGDDFKKEIN